MGFKAKEFVKAALQPREVTLREEIVDLAPWFNGPPEWTLRSITYDEYEGCRQRSLGAVQRLGEAVASFLEKQGQEQIEEAKKAAQEWNRLLPSTQLSCEMLAIASVEPKIDIRIAIRLSEAHPVEFGKLAGAAWELFGKGQVTQKKSSDSTESVSTFSPSSSSEADTSTSTAPTSSPGAT